MSMLEKYYLLERGLKGVVNGPTKDAASGETKGEALASPPPSRALEDDPKYAEYFELLKTCRGVSVMAVKSKMKAAGLDPAILDKGSVALEEKMRIVAEKMRIVAEIMKEPNGE